jgi:hypothetical protein
MVKLTNATEAFVILLHVSSFANTPTPRPYTPLVNGLSSNSAVIGAASDDPHPGLNLTRSRSAQASAPKTATPLLREPPHSASSQQTFRIPPLPHQAKIIAGPSPDAVT